MLKSPQRKYQLSESNPYRKRPVLLMLSNFFQGPITRSRASLKGSALIFVPLLLVTHLAFSDDTKEICSLERQFAELIMTKRQEEYPLSWIMETNKWEFGAEFDWAQSLVISAYETPRFWSKEKQTSAVTSFGRKVESACYRSRLK